MSYPLTLDEFKSWLESKSEDEIVGEQRRLVGCPIFNCIKGKRDDIFSLDFGITHFLNTKIFKAIDNPDWVERFINKVDDRQIIPLKQGEMNASITATQALEVINNLYICTKCNKYNPEGIKCSREDCDW